MLKTLDALLASGRFRGIGEISAVHFPSPGLPEADYDPGGPILSGILALVIGKPVDDALALHEEFLTLMQGKGQVEPDEETLEDAVAFAGVARFPARVKCALLSWMAWKDATTQSLEATP